MSRKEVLELTRKELFDYSIDGYYWKLDELGVKYKRPLSEEEIENRKEEEARLKSIYYKESNKGS